MENKRFAWWPIKITSGKLVWLQQYIYHRNLYDETTGRPPINSLYFEWTETPQEQTFRVLKESIQHNWRVTTNEAVALR